jgi:hypothetical protein
MSEKPARAAEVLLAAHTLFAATLLLSVPAGPAAAQTVCDDQGNCITLPDPPPPPPPAEPPAPSTGTAPSPPPEE